jgi:Holliday junction DNA helicase RuvA
MIFHLTGKVIHKGLGFVVLETAGIGYKVAVTGDTLSQIGTATKDTVSLWTHHVIREDTSDLYGFLTLDEVEFFELLISISGIGPKTGLGVMNASSMENLKTAIGHGEISYLTKISGIGKKIAEKIIFELRDKVIANGNEGGEMQGDTDVLEALISLGYGERETREVVKNLNKNVTGPQNRIKEALKVLGKK